MILRRKGLKTEPRLILTGVLLFFLFLPCPVVLTAGLVETGETAEYFVLENGLKVFLLEKRNVPLVNVVAAVDLGSKDETPETSGIVHVLEHYILFRGTEVRSGSDIGRDVRRHGAYFNAHTGNDLALFEISVPANAADFALNNQREILFRLKIEQDELDKEKEVILEELRQLEDDPFRYATALAYQNLFHGHPYSNPLIGDAEVIKNLSAGKFSEFYRRYFIPANCALAVVGDFSIADMKDKVRAVFSEIQGESFPRAAIEPPAPPEKNLDLDVEMDVQKAYLLIAVQAPDFNSPDQYSMDVLTEILGRGINPLLYSALNQGQRRLVETLSMAYLTHRFGGALLVYCTLDPRNLNRVRREAVGFLRKAREQNFSPEDVYGAQQMFIFDRLGSAKNHITYRAYRSQERGLSLAVSLAQFMILSEGQAERKYLDNISRVTSGNLRKTAADYLSRANYVTVSILPKKGGMNK
ncbi:MAG: pitrilysin family protein [Candidatus Aminicenantales bacterium]